MNKDLISISAAPAKLSINFDELKVALEKDVAQYDVVVTTDTVGDAKKLATKLNKQASELDAKRKEVVAQVSEPIKTFEGQMRELVGLYKGGRQKILDQVQVFEDETRETARRLLGELLDELNEEYEIEAEFRRAGFDDLIKISSVTAKANLTQAAKDALEGRVRDDKSLQDRTRIRLTELENRSYKAGLTAPLTRDHVQHFLFSDDETYGRELQRILDAEIQRQEAAERAVQGRADREARAKAQAEQEAAERQRRLDAQAQEQPPAEGAPEPAEQPVATQPQPAPEPPSEPAKPGNVAWRVTCIFDLEVGSNVPASAIEKELRRIMDKAGITTLSSVQVQQHKEAA